VGRRAGNSRPEIDRGSYSDTSTDGNSEVIVRVEGESPGILLTQVSSTTFAPLADAKLGQSDGSSESSVSAGLSDILAEMPPWRGRSPRLDAESTTHSTIEQPDRRDLEEATSTQATETPPPMPPRSHASTPPPPIPTRSHASTPTL